MDDFNMGTLEKKYPGVTDSDEWFDLHDKRGQEKINDEEFRNGLLEFGLEESDADKYIKLLEETNDILMELLDDPMMDEMHDIGMAFEGFVEKEDEIADLIQSGKVKKAKKIMQEDIKMPEEDIEIVVKFYQD